MTTGYSPTIQQIRVFSAALCTALKNPLKGSQNICTFLTFTGLKAVVLTVGVYRIT